MAIGNGGNGRHDTYDDTVAERVCALITSGKTLPEICGQAGIPSERTIFYWLRDPAHEDFRTAYREAIELREDRLVDEALCIARTPQFRVRREVITNPDGGITTKEVEIEMVEHRRLLSDVLFKHAAKLAPKKYGDRVKTEVSGPDDGPVETKMVMKIKVIPRKTDAELRFRKENGIHCL